MNPEHRFDEPIFLETVDSRLQEHPPPSISLMIPMHIEGEHLTEVIGIVNCYRPYHGHVTRT